MPNNLAAVVLRSTLTRPAMPIFMLCAGYLLARKGGFFFSVPRVRRLFGAAIAATGSTWLLAWPQPEIVTIYVVAVMLLGRLVVRVPLAIAVLSYIQFKYWPIGGIGYQPGAVVMWMAVGVLVPAVPLMPVKCLPVLGRHPLKIYLAHLYILALVGK